MIIEIPDCRFRIKGEECDWQVQYPKKRNGEQTFEGKYFYPTLDEAIAKAYELALRESGSTADLTVDLKAALAECRRVKSGLEGAVRKAMGA